jgi:hypothetical protein
LVKVVPENRPALKTGSLHPDFALASRVLASNRLSEKKNSSVKLENLNKFGFLMPSAYFLQAWEPMEEAF